MSSQLQVSGEAKIRAIQGPVVANSGVITALNGGATQYVRGDGTLADFPTSTGGGSSVSYYLNSSVSQGTIGGVAYRQLSKTPISGAGTDIAISTTGYVASYLTDANDPALLEVPAGNFNCEFYFSVNSNSHNPYVYAELYKYDGTTFTLLGSNVAIPEYLTNGTTLSAYYFAIPVAVAALTVTDRIAIRIYVNVDGRTVTLHTENNHLCQVVTTFSKGLISLNNLTRQNQFFGTGTSGTDFGISSSVATHTFNLPVASAANTGKLSSTDWSTFNNKQATLSFTAPLDNTSNTISIPVATSIVDGYLDNADWVNFNTAYNNMIVSAAVTGTTTKTLTLTQQDAGTITASWTDDNTDAVTSVFGRTGAVVATSGDYTTTQVTEGTNLYFTDARARAAISLTTTGTSGAATYTSGVLNIPQYQGVLTNPITGTGATTEIAYFNGTTSITSEAAFNYDASLNRLGVNTTNPNATIGGNSALDAGYGLLIKTGAANYNGIGIAIDSTYGNLISTEKLGTASARNLTLLNQSGFISLTESGNLGLNVLTPAVSGNGIDIYGSTSVGLRFHTATSGTTVTDGAGINFSAANNLGISNYEAGTIDIVTNGNSGVFIASNGYVGINGAAAAYALDVTGAIKQTSVISSLLKTDLNGLIIPAVAGTDYQVPLSNIVTGSSAANNLAIWNGTTTLTGTSNLWFNSSSNFLGIGTNNPQRSLTIYNATLDSQLQVAGGAPSVALTEAVTGGIYQAKFAMATAAGHYVSGSVAGDFILLSQTGATIFATSSTEKMRLLSTGLLLLNTTSSNGALLQVNGTATFAGGITGTSATFSGILSATSGDIRSLGTATDAVTSGPFISVRDSSNAYQMLMQLNASYGLDIWSYTGSWNKRLTITSGGNVGIGTSSPDIFSRGDATIVGISASGASDNMSLQLNAGASGGRGAQIYMGQGGTRHFTLSSNVSETTLGTTSNTLLKFTTNDTERMRITSGGLVGIGTVNSYLAQLNVGRISAGATTRALSLYNNSSNVADTGVAIEFYPNTGNDDRCAKISSVNTTTVNNADLRFFTSNDAAPVERMRITSGGNVLIGKNTTASATVGINFEGSSGFGGFTRGDGAAILVNRQNNDGDLVVFLQGDTQEGSISVSGSTVSYNGGHLSRWSQTESDIRIEGLLKGTVMSNLDKMAQWIDPQTEQPYENEQLNCMKISDVEGDINVAGVFVNWDNDDKEFTSDMNIAMTGDMIIRIAQNLVVQRGQLLMSAGDGTAKPQEDNIIRSKTIAKITSNHITCVYEDGSYCVPCVLMAC